VLVHGLGGSWHSWATILEPLAAERDVIVPDLAGFGASPPLPGATTIATLSDALTAFFAEQGLVDVDVVGSSMVRGSCWNSLGAARSARPSHSIRAAFGKAGSARSSEPRSRFRSAW